MPSNRRGTRVPPSRAWNAGPHKGERAGSAALFDNEARGAGRARGPSAWHLYLRRDQPPMDAAWPLAPRRGTGMKPGTSVPGKAPRP
jgi:hypothetical protein